MYSFFDTKTPVCAPSRPAPATRSPVTSRLIYVSAVCVLRRSQEEEGQGRSRVHDDAEGRSSGHGVQGTGAAGRQGAAGEQDRAHLGPAGGVQEAVQRRPWRFVQDHVRDRQAAGAHPLAPVRRARRHRHVRQLRQQRPVRPEHRAVRGAVPAAGRVPGPRQGRRRRRQRRSDGDVLGRFVAGDRHGRRAARNQPQRRSSLTTHRWDSAATPATAVQPPTLPARIL